MGSLQPITSNQKLIIIKVIMEVQEKYRTIENTKETEEERINSLGFIENEKEVVEIITNIKETI